MAFTCCENCSGKNKNEYGFEIYPPGYIYVPEDKFVIECDCHKKWREEYILKHNYENSGFPKSLFEYNPRTYAGKKSKNNFNRICNFAKKFSTDERLKNLIIYIYGPNGTQKTTVMSYIGKLLLGDDIKCRYVLMNSLIKLLQDYQFNDGKASYEIEKIKNSSVIIIDEAFDKEKVLLYKSGFQMSFIDSFIREMFSQGKCLIFISNIKREDISSQGFSPSIQDIIIRETSLKNTYLTFEDNYIAESGVEYNPNESLF